MTKKKKKGKKFPSSQGPPCKGNQSLWAVFLHSLPGMVCVCIIHTYMYQHTHTHAHIYTFIIYGLSVTK